LASQYKSMYPSLEIDVDGELAKLKVRSLDVQVIVKEVEMHNI